MKKFLRYLGLTLALFIALPAQAVLPLAALVYTSSGVYANLNLAVALGALMSAFGLGVGVGYMAIQNPTDSGGSAFRVPLTAQVQVPEPDSAGPAVDPGGSKWQSTGSVNGSYGPYFDTFCEAATSYIDRYCANNNYDCNVTACTNSTKSGNWTLRTQPTQPLTYLTISASDARLVEVPPSCPDGSHMVGVMPNAECVLDNPRSVPDGNCDYARNGTSLSALNDADCVQSGVRGLVCNSTSCVAVGVNEQGNRQRIEITPTADGGTVVEVNTQNNVGGTPVVDTVSVTIGGDGAVTGVVGDSNTGTVPNDGSAPTNPNTGTGTSDVTFPSDYARTGEAANAAKSITDKLDTLIGTFDGPASGVSPVQAWDDRINAVSGLSASTPVISWVPSILPGTPVGCTAIQIDGSIHGGLLNGMTGTASLDICDKLSLVRQILGYLFMVLTTIFVYRRFTRSNASAGG